MSADDIRTGARNLGGGIGCRRIGHAESRRARTPSESISVIHPAAEAAVSRRRFLETSGALAIGIAKATLVNPVSSLARAAPDPERAPQARCEQSARVGSVGCLVQAIPATTSRSVQPAKSAFWTALNYTARSAGATRGMCPRFGKFLHKRRQDLTFPTSKRSA